MAELPKCSLDGCEKNARSRKGSYCQMHYTRERTHGDVNVNLYADRGQKWELPDGIIIREAKKIENLKIIIERIKNTRLLGYNKDGNDTLDIIEKVLDDYHGTYKNGEVKRGKKTLTFAKYVNALENSNRGFEHGLITLEQSKLISKVVSELKNNEEVKFLDICTSQEIESFDMEWLINLFAQHPIIGITFNPEAITVKFTQDIKWFYELASKRNKPIFTQRSDALELGLHKDRISEYMAYASKLENTPK
ncbi:MAG: hypothetical protein RI100_06015 [Nitrosarchaeum sp.]|uniref:hypothetical protein n=1 Tax=Nitrosarchaeum sp. TaxID=2026886 RepID=UPI002DF25F56|nr:hypothetical protein [Nitrosarchaeum sp.]